MSVELKASPAALPGRTSLPEPGHVHVWRIALASPGAALAGLFHELSPTERDRSGRFRFRPDAEAFIAAHVALRRILGSYAGVPAEDLEFATGAFGKPSFAHGEGECRSLTFNMADSGQVALLAVACGGEVGIDIEKVKPGGDLDAAASRCFCDAELGIFRSASVMAREDIFFKFWSRKEAYIKARGEGLSLPLKEIDVSAAPAFIGGRWWLEDLAVDPEYRGAVVLDGRIRAIEYKTMSFRADGGPA